MGLGRFVLEFFFVGGRLECLMNPSMHRLRSRYVPVWVDILGSFGSLAAAFEGLFHSFIFVCDHSIRISTSRYHHCGIGASSHYSSIMHDILRKVLPKIIMLVSTSECNVFITKMTNSHLDHKLSKDGE